MNTAELIYRRVKEMPEFEAQQVLDFMESLRAKREHDESKWRLTGDREKPITLEENNAWCERLRVLIESQPMTQKDTVMKLRQWARY